MDHKQLNEGLRSNDLKEYVEDLFTIDQYKSKMGEDKDMVVLGFTVKEKNPAADLVEFIEKGYRFILDADMSVGEENDGLYRVFVEMERTPRLPKQIKELLSGISQLTDCYDWRFRYQKAGTSVEFDENTMMEHVPVTPEEYDMKIVEMKNTDIGNFFDQGTVEVTVESDNSITFSKPYSGDVTAKFIGMGSYDEVKDALPGGLSLDESSQSQTMFLTKYLGNYDINKIGDKFLIRNGSQAIVIQKDRW